ncbi:hypothetical protein LKL35_29300 [Streptomyces sp. ET3-23]|uniref:hypothetical protein n=1 Tax=Streptomyces sp. ET3-23 TaxID=2885643 RepID=UPI001D11BE25|nr:hypothetical protein [Streptomyces sp. ET3-23]MCC2279496.1 hypothetical protein [Streptomyces sp. ET3-23]
MMKRYADDAATLRIWAAEAGSWPRPADRLRAVTAVFHACGELASAYHCPSAVYELLVNEVAATFVATRRGMRRAVAA